jgi:hypothetical protein
MPIKCTAILRDRIYLFKGEFTRVKNAILNYINFVSVVNNIKLRRLSNFKD